MTTVYRLLPGEYGVLEGIADGFKPDPRSSVAVVAIDAGEFVGRIFLVAPAHVEGPWVREDRRGTPLFAQLVRRAEREAKKAGVTALYAYGAGKKMEGLIERLGYKRQDLSVWKKEI